MKTKKLIIYGVGAQAELAYAYFEKDSNYTVIAFAVEKSYLKEDNVFGVPVLPFESIEERVAPTDADMFVAIGPIKLNMVLKDFCEKARAKGYKLASYCPAIVTNYFEPSFDENCFFDHATQFHPFVKIGRGVTMIASNVGHHVEIGNFTFITTTTIGGKVIIEDHVFIGMGTVIKEGVRIGKGSIIGMGCHITKDVAPYSVYSIPGTKPRENADSRDIELFKKRPLS
jgi:hypothetical protein